MLQSSLAPPDAQPDGPPSFQQGVETLASHFGAASELTIPVDPEVAVEVKDVLEGESSCESWAGMGVRPDASLEDVKDDRYDHLEELNRLFTDQEVCSVLSRLGSKTSVGPDCIPFAMLKEGCDVLSKPLCRLFNLSWSYGVVPQSWRDADVIALYKGSGGLEDCDNYRPISLTSTLARTFERLIYPRLYSVVNPRLSVWQSGFRRQRSTLDQIAAIVERIRLSFSKRQHLPVVFLDIKKAFDRVWHDGLLYKLFVHFRVAGRCWSWIRAFLTGRRLRVRASGHLSGWRDVPNGVPQGSVLAPLLFLVFINDLAVQLEESECDPPLFADDTAILPALHVSPDRHQIVMQNGLDVTWLWSRKWRVEWGFKKCALVVFYRTRLAPDRDDWSLRLGLEVLRHSDHYVYLGITLHERLSWKMHFDRVYKATCFASWRLCRWIRLSEPHGKVSVPIVRQLVLACVRSCFGYGLPVWRPTQAQVVQLQRCLVTPLRHVLCLPRTVSYVGVLVECDVPPVTLWMQQLALRLARRFMHLPSSHSARVVFEQLMAQGVHMDSLESDQYLVRLPLGHLALAIQARWFGVNEVDWAGGDNVVRAWGSIWDPELKLSSSELSVRCYVEAVEQGRCASLFQVKSSPGLSPYLRSDKRAMAAHRARLRLDSARLNASLHRRRRTDEPGCLDCPWAAETPEHILLHCDTFASERAVLERTLRRFGLELSLRLVLGEWGAAVGTNDEVMKALRRFILSIQSIRDF